MWYTHYLEEQHKHLTPQQKKIANALYQKILRVIIVSDNNPLPIRTNLYDVFIDFQKRWKDLFDENFHEWARDKEGKPILFPLDDSDGWVFTKTNRKRYDLAVYATMKTLYDAIWYGFSSDAGCVNIDESEYPSLQEYKFAELDDAFQYDFELIQGFCDAARQELEATEINTKIGNLTIEWPVNVDDLRHIATMISNWYTSSPQDGAYLGQPAWSITNI